MCPETLPQGARVAGLALAAGSGLLYGLVNVLAKPVALDPAWKTLALYAASAIVLAPFLRGLRLARQDVPRVLAMGVFGGGIAPLLLFIGLPETAAADSGFLLTLEMVATAGLAALFLRERYGGGEVAGLGFLLLTSATIAAASAQGAGAGVTGATTLRGAAFVLGAAVAWGIDNTVSAHLVGNYRVTQLIAVKGAIGAAFAGSVALVVQPPVTSLADMGWMALLGIVSIACSSLLFYNALKRIGAGKTSAMNLGTTAVMGAVGGAVYLHERLTWLHAGAFVLLLAGAALLWRGRAHASSTSAPG